jgi:Uri superfamily endonuclease
MPPSLPGTCVLLLALPSSTDLVVGALGPLKFPAGYYAYVGSALGPGGLAGRVSRHLRLTDRPHWHIDALRAHAHPIAIWYAVGDKRRECSWARELCRLEGASTPALGFGSGDCRCASHLIHFASPPDHRSLAHPSGDALLCESVD